MKRYFKYGCLLISVGACAFLLYTLFKGQSAYSDYGFLAQMSGYWAGGTDESGPMAFTLFYKGELNYDPSDVVKIEFDNIGNEISVEEVELQKKEDTESNENYGQEIFSCTIHARAQGTFSADRLNFYLGDGTVIQYPFGKWTFDIAAPEDDKELVNTWESTMVASNHTEFIYRYKVKPGVKIKSIQIGDHNRQTGEDVAPEGRIPLDAGTYVSFIRSKIQVEYEGMEYVYYGKGYYAGAMDIPLAVVEEMSQFVGEGKPS